MNAAATREGRVNRTDRAGTLSRGGPVRHPVRGRRTARGRALLALALAAALAPAPLRAAPGERATPLITIEDGRTVWHRDASPGEPPLIVQVVRRAMAASGDTSVRESDAALRILSRHALARGWALLRMAERSLAARDSARADSFLVASQNAYGLWRADALQRRLDLALARGGPRAVLQVLDGRPPVFAASRRGDWEWLRAKCLAAVGDTVMAVRALGLMQSMGTPPDSARPALALLESLMAGRTGSAPGQDEWLAARLMADARDTRAQADWLKRAVARLEAPRERFDASLALATALRRTRRDTEARALLNALRPPAEAPEGGPSPAARQTMDRARILVALGDLDRVAGRPAAADGHYAKAAGLLVPGPDAKPSDERYRIYREAVQDRADLAFTRDRVSEARSVFTSTPADVPDRGAWRLRAGVLSMVLGERGSAERQFAAADDGAFWLGVLRRRASRAAGDSVLRRVAGREDFEFYTAAARETLGAAPRPITPADARPGPDGPAWLRQAELLYWLGEAGDAATLVERAIDWQAEVRANGAIAEMGFMEGRHWLRAARIAYLTGRPTAGIRLAHRPRWRALHDLPPDVERAGVLPWMYPPAFDTLYAAYGKKSGVDPALLSAIGWQESFFDEKAVSRAGALGVMQFMPATARLVARRMGEPAPSQADLLEADRSIRLGADYFAGLMRQFGGAVPPALAAYNAGPGRANTWIGRANGDRGALFCEVIGFDETINYVQNILGAWQAYRWLAPRWE